MLGALRDSLGSFLRKDQDDETNFFITFLKGIKFGNFTSGALGTGGAVTVDDQGNSSAEFDYLTIRKAATFRSITILELKHIGGELGITAGAMKVSRVEELADAYRCFFDTTDGKRQVYQEFVVGDQARCQQFRLDPDPTEQGMLRTKYYWRLVTAVGEDWVELSKTDCDNGSGIPGVGDEVVQLGYRGSDHQERQSAIILSAVSSDAPSQKFYQGINSYNLVDKFVKEEGYDPTTGLFHCNIYGNFFVGDKGLSPTNYVKYTRGSYESQLDAWRDKHSGNTGYVGREHPQCIRGCSHSPSRCRCCPCRSRCLPVLLQATPRELPTMPSPDWATYPRAMRISLSTAALPGAMRARAWRAIPP